MSTSGRCPACMAVVFVSACVLGGTRAPSGARAPSCQGAGSTGTRLCASIPGDRPATHRAADQPVNKAYGSRGLAGTARGEGAGIRVFQGLPSSEPATRSLMSRVRA